MKPQFVLPVLIPLVIYIAHSLAFGSWIVDDAAITFAYARNLGQGYGLVSQPGMPPVEGYSNFTWTVMLAPFFTLGLFDPVITPKLLAVVLVGGAFALVTLALRPLPYGGWIALGGLSLAALNTSFVVWTISGLENALYIALVALLFYGLVQPTVTSKQAAGLGALAALIAMTRPDGLLFGLLFPIIRGLSVIPTTQSSVLSPQSLFLRFKPIVVYLFGFGAVYGAFLLFRLAYFGALMPNTYTMKGGPEMADVVALATLQPKMVEKAQRILESMAGTQAMPLLFALALVTVVLIVFRRFSRVGLVLLLFALCAAGIYLLLPPDWMGEYRFATPFILFFYVYVAYAVVILIAVGTRFIASAITDRVYPVPTQVTSPTFIQQHPSRLFLALMLMGVYALVMVEGYGWFAPRSQRFAQQPTVPFQTVKSEYADKFDWYGDVLGIETASVLLPDVGGMLYYSRHQIYDLAGLTDRTVAQTLGKHINRPVFYTYVFEEVQPTFIHMHGHWTVLARLDNDPRFREQYVPLCEYVDPWIRQTYRVERYSGDYVRREIAEAQPEAIAEIQNRVDERCGIERG